MKKYLKPVLALVLVAALAIGGTLAYLTDTTEEVKNKFTPDEEIDIYLIETKQDYTIIPGGEEPKNPSVEVEPTSNDSYVFVEVTENILTAALDASDENSDKFTDYVTYDIADGWVLVKTIDESDATNTITKYVYARATSLDALTTVEASDSLQILKNDKVTYPTTVTQQMIAKLGETTPTLAFQAYAIQTDNIEKPAGSTESLAEYVYGLVGEAIHGKDSGADGEL